MNTRRFTFSHPNVTAQVSDEANNFLWAAFAKDTDGNCNIKKLFGFDLDQVYFDIDRAVDKVVKMAIDTTNLYLAYEDDSLFGEVITKTNPLTSTTEISIPAGVTEFPVDIRVGSSLFFLTPGVASGTNAKIIRYNTSGVFQQTIDLSKSGAEVNNASSFEIDDNGDLWVITNESPAKYIRVFDTGGFVWDFEIFSTI